jgi:hypothetical protein
VSNFDAQSVRLVEPGPVGRERIRIGARRRHEIVLFYQAVFSVTIDKG